MRTCQGCRVDTATGYAVWHIVAAGVVVSAGGHHVCPACLEMLRESGATVSKLEKVGAE